MLHSYILYVVVLLIALLPMIVMSIINTLYQKKENEKHKAITKQREMRENLYINRLNKNLSKKKK